MGILHIKGREKMIEILTYLTYQEVILIMFVIFLVNLDLGNQNGVQF